MTRLSNIELILQPGAICLLGDLCSHSKDCWGLRKDRDNVFTCQYFYSMERDKIEAQLTASQKRVAELERVVNLGLATVQVSFFSEGWLKRVGDFVTQVSWPSGRKRRCYPIP